MGDQPGAGGPHSYKIRGHSRQRRSTKPYSRPSDRKKGVLESVKNFFSPSWLVDFWKGKITPEEEEVEEDEDVEEPENPTEKIERRQDTSGGSSELVNTRLTGQTSSNTKDSSDKVYGNGGLGSVASAQIPSQTSRKSGLTAFLAVTSRYQSNKETVVTRTTGSASTNTESSRPVEQERLEAPSTSGSLKDHIDTRNQGEFSSSSQILPTRTVSTTKDSESSPPSFILNPGPSRKPMQSIFSTSTPMPGASTDTSVAQLSERMTSSSTSRPQPTSVFRNRPEFSLAAFGSPLPPEKSSQNKRLLSPYYPGKTTFGGASSQFTKSTKRMRLSSPSSVEPFRPVKKQIKPTSIAGPGVGGVASQTAKRILETLEKMSSPLVDAKKIPPSPLFSASSSPLSFEQSSRRKQPYQKDRAIGSPRKLQAQFGAPPVQPLSIPQRASISRIHHKVQSTRTSTITSQAQEPTSTGQFSRTETFKPTSTFTPTPLPMSLSPMESSKGGGKMRTAKTNTHYKSQMNKEDEEEVINPLPEIVSAVPLNIPCSSTLPTFSFSPSSSSSKSVAITTSTTKLDYSFAAPKSKQSDITSNNFKFSLPEPKALSSLPSTTNQTSPERKTLYSFSLPAPVNKIDTSTMSDDVKNTTTKPSLDKYKPAEGTPKTTQKITLPSNGLFKQFAPPIGSWSCETCLLSNKSTDDKCIACNTPKPSSSTTSVSKSDDIFKRFAPSQDSWECSACMINNNGSESKCIACQTPKPTTSQSTGIPLPSKTNDDLRNKFAPSKDSWECSMCMLNNKASESKCVACQTPNPTSSQKPSLPFASKSDDLMKKFAPPQDSWECSTCMVNNKDSNSKCSACQMPRPGGESTLTTSSKFNTGTLANTFASASGSWTCDTCMIVNKPDTLKCLACESAKPGSASAGSFGSATGNSATKSSFTFGGPSKESTAKPAFQFGSSSKSDSSSSSALSNFGSSTVTTASQPVVFGGPSDSSNSGSSFTFGKSIASTSDTKTSDSSSSAPSFTFGASAANTNSSKPTIQFGITADPKPSESPKKEPSTVQSGANATSVDSQPKIQFGVQVTTDEKKTSPFIFGGGTPAIQFGSGSLVKESTPKAIESPAKGKRSTIAEAAAAGLLKIPSSTTPVAVVDLTDDDSNKDKVSAPPNVNLFPSGTQPSNQMFSTAAAAVTTQSGTTGSTTLPSLPLPFAFGATPVSKPADEPPKAMLPFAFLTGASNTVVSTASGPAPALAGTASPFNFASPLGSNNKALSNPTASSLVTPQFGSFGVPVSNTSVPGFPAVNATATTAEASTPFAFKGTTATSTNGKFATPAAGGFAFGAQSSNAASGSGGFAFGTTSVVPSEPSATSAPFVFGGQSTTEPKSGFNFSATNQPFAFGASAPPATNAQVSAQVPEESMDADGNNNSSQPAVPVFVSQPTPSATPFNFNPASTGTAGFNFGGTQSPATFKFGSGQQPSVGGGTPGAATLPSFGAPAPTLPGASGGFNFGSPATNSMGSTQPSGFMAGGSSAGAFSAGTGGVQTKRIIKKGVRRMKR